MTDDSALPGIPVVIDEWNVVLWADAKIPAASAARLISLVDAELAIVATRLTDSVAAASPGSGASARVEVTERHRS